MRIRKVDNDSQWTFGKGLNNYVEQDAAIEQNIRCRLLSWEGECFWDLKNGIDWRNLLDKGQQENLAMAIKTNILQAYGVASIEQLSLDLDVNRKLTITYAVKTIYGTEFQSTINRGL